MLHLVHCILNTTFTLVVNLCVLVHPKISKQPQPSPLPLPIHPCPIPCPCPSHRQGSSTILNSIIPSGVPFELPCPICQHSLKQDQICHHSDPCTTIIRQDHTEPLWIHQESPFVFCHHLPNPDDPTCTILLQCPINPEIHSNSDGENIPPSPLRTDSSNAYHLASSTRESSPTKERSVFSSRDLQQNKLQAHGTRGCQSLSPKDTMELPSDVHNVFGEATPHPSSTPQYTRNICSSARRSLPSQKSTETGDQQD